MNETTTKAHHVKPSDGHVALNGETPPSLQAVPPLILCRMPGCGAPVPPKTLFCHKCWRNIPNDLRVSFIAAQGREKKMAAYDRIMVWCTQGKS